MVQVIEGEAAAPGLGSVAQYESYNLPIAELGRRLRNGGMSSVDLTEAALDYVEAMNPDLHPFITVTRDQARADAVRADRELSNGIDRGPLHGIPYGLKDIYDTAGILTTCHSRLKIDHVPPRDSAVYERLRQGGAVLLGKLSTHEFATGGPSLDVPFPPALNPWNRQHFTGGSSSGTAVAIAGGFLRTAMGSDTGGSIRGPAHYCGVVGLKPTYGVISRRGIFPLAPSLDHAGPISRSISDAALTLQVVAGFDPDDPGSAKIEIPDYSRFIGQGIEKRRIAFPRHFHSSYPNVTTDVVKALDSAAEILARLGAQVQDVSLPDYDVFEAAGRVILQAEAHAIHESSLRERPGDYARYTYLRLMSGAALSAADYIQANRVRRSLTKVMNEELLSRFDVVLCAAALEQAPDIRTFTPRRPPRQQLRTMPFNLTGNPAVVLPGGFSADNLPVGIQMVGRMFDEPVLLGVAAAFEAATDWHLRRPPLS